MLQQSRLTRRTTVTLMAVVISMIGVSALAATEFTDVSPDDIFYDDIQWMATEGISKGCNPPTNTSYCPKDNLTREQMAAFLHRLALSQAVDAGTLDGYDSSDFVKAGSSPESGTGNADTVDGKHASDFYQVGDKVGDADTVDGHHSDDFVLDGEVASALSGSFYTESTTQEVTVAAAFTEIVASCEAGDVVISGGFEAEDLLGGLLNAGVNITDSYPSEGTWIVEATASIESDVTAFAVCLDVTP